MIIAKVVYRPLYMNEHFTLPGIWEGEVVSGLERFNKEGRRFRVYSFADSEIEVVDNLMTQLREAGIHDDLMICGGDADETEFEIQRAGCTKGTLLRFTRERS